MKRLLTAFALASFLLAAPALADTQVRLRDHVVAPGAAVTLGDVFDGAGAAGARAIAPAPPPGQTSTLSMAVLAAATSAAGLDWTPPQGMTGVSVTRATSPHSSGLRATVPNADAQPQQQQSAARSVPDAVVHRGETVLITYSVPGVQIATRARAMEDGAVGQDIRLTNITSNRAIEATVTGPGAANAGPTP